MPNYMILIHENETAQQQMTPAAMKAHVDAHVAYAAQLKSSGAYVDCDRLRPSVEGRRVDSRTVQAGPFADDVLGAYYLVEATSLDAAGTIADACPRAPGDSIEVRQVRGGAAPKKGKGKTFAVFVHGRAKSEPAWVELMDRIDAENTDCFTETNFAGGFRLEPPSKGRVMGNARIGADGPFLESKEIVGGVAFLRMADVDEAERWARGTEFVKRGTLEIRELWRA